MTKVTKQGEYISFANRASASFYATDSFKKHPLSHTHYSSLSSCLSNIKKPKSTTRTRNKTTFLSTNYPQMNSLKFDSFHFTHLRNKLLSNQDYQYLTERTNIFLTTDSTHHSRKFSFSSQLDKDRPIKPITPFLLTNAHFLPVCTEDNKVFNPNSPRIENINEFLKKSKALRRVKYINLIEKEKQKQFIEEQQIKTQEKDVQISSFYFTKQLLDEYKKHFNSYLKFLHNEIEENKKELIELMLNVNNLIRDIKQLNQKILRYRKEITNGKMYKNFFLCVKYKVLNVNLLPKETLIRYKIITQSTINRTRANSRIVLNNQINPQRRSVFVKRSSIKHGSRLSTVKKETRINDTQKVQSNQNEKDELIFKTLDEFEQCFQNIENNTMKLFNFQNDITCEINSLKYERDKLDEQRILLNKVQNQEEKQLINKLNTIKTQNNKLKMQLLQIEQYKQAISKKKVLNKIVGILLALPLNLEKTFDCPNIYNLIQMKTDTILVKGIKQNSLLYFLSLIEKVLLKEMQQHEEFLSNFKLSLEIGKIKIALDTRKKMQNSREKVNKEKLRREQLNLNIMKKFNKLLYIPNGRKSLSIKYGHNNDNENERNEKGLKTERYHRKKGIKTKGRNIQNENLYNMLTY